MVREGRGTPRRSRSRARTRAGQRGRHDQLTEWARQDVALAVEVGEQLAVESGGHLPDGPEQAAALIGDLQADGVPGQHALHSAALLQRPDRRRACSGVVMRARRARSE
jgi:hypothetical protein